MNIDQLDWFITHGYKVVPVRGKAPLIRAWPQDASADKNVIQSWIRQWPGCGFALLLGDLIDVETDTDGGTEALHFFFPSNDYPCWKSKRGLHSLWKRPQTELPSVAKIECFGLEFRLGGKNAALSVLPPSVHPDGIKYAWIRAPADFPPQELPITAVACIWLHSLGFRKARLEWFTVIEEGSRNVRLTEICGHLASQECDPDKVFRWLKCLNLLCTLPLGNDELQTIVKSICKRESAKQNSSNIVKDFTLKVVRDVPYRFRLKHVSWLTCIELTGKQLYSFSQVRAIAAEILKAGLNSKYQRKWAGIVEKLLAVAEEIDPETPEEARRMTVAYAFWRWLDEHMPSTAIDADAVINRIGAPQRLRDGTIAFQFASALEDLSMTNEKVKRAELCRLLETIKAGRRQIKRRTFMILTSESMQLLAEQANITLEEHDRSTTSEERDSDFAERGSLVF